MANKRGNAFLKRELKIAEQGIAELKDAAFNNKTLSITGGRTVFYKGCLAYGAVVKGKLVYSSNNGCYGGFNRGEYFKGSDLMFSACTTGADKNGTPSNANFVDYLINRSPYSNAFVTKDVNEAVYNGVIMDGHAPLGFSMGGLLVWKIVYKQRKELNTNLHIWNCLTENGCNEDLAFIISMLFGNQISARGSGTGMIHSCTFTKKGIDNFLNKRMCPVTIKGNTSKSFYKIGMYRSLNKETNDGSIFMMFNDNKGRTHTNKELVEGLIAFARNNGVEFPLQYDPFTKKELPSKYFSISGNEEVIVDWTKKTFPEAYQPQGLYNGKIGNFVKKIIRRKKCAA